MTKCANCREQLSLYLDGAMTAEEKKLVEEHLSICPQCSSVLSELKKTKDTLHNLEDIEPPPWFTQNIMNSVRKEAESKKGFLHKLFYPLHIKIPAEVLATCVVAILTIFIFKNIEPEMKTFEKPEEILAPSQQSQVEKHGNETLTLMKEKEGPTGHTLKDSQEQQKPQVPPASSQSSGTGALIKDMPAALEAPPAELQAVKKNFDKTESIPAPAAPATADAQGSTKFRSSNLQSKAAADTEKRQLLLTVSTNTLEKTIKETEDLLRRFSAANITKTTREHGSVKLGGDLPGQKVKDFYNALKTMGSVEEKEITDNFEQENVTVMINITTNQ